MSTPANPDSLMWTLWDTLTLLAFIISSVFASIRDARLRVLDERAGNFLLLLGSSCFAVNILVQQSFTWTVGVRSVALGYLMTYLLSRLGIMGLGDVKYLVSTFMMFPTALLSPFAPGPLPISLGGLTYPFPVVVTANSLILVVAYLAIRGFSNSISRFSVLSLIAGATAAVVSPMVACLALVPLALRSRSTQVPFIPFAFAGTLLSLVIGGIWRGLV